MYAAVPIPPDCPTCLTTHLLHLTGSTNTLLLILIHFEVPFQGGGRHQQTNEASLAGQTKAKELIVEVFLYTIV